MSIGGTRILWDRPLESHSFHQNLFLPVADQHANYHHCCPHPINTHTHTHTLSLLFSFYLQVQFPCDIVSECRPNEHHNRVLILTNDGTMRRDGEEGFLAEEEMGKSEEKWRYREKFAKSSVPGVSPFDSFARCGPQSGPSSVWTWRLEGQRSPFTPHERIFRCFGSSRTCCIPKPIPMNSFSSR